MQQLFNSRRFSADPDVQNDRFLGVGKSVFGRIRRAFRWKHFSRGSTKPEGQQFLECYVLTRPREQPPDGRTDGRSKRPTPSPSFIPFPSLLFRSAPPRQNMTELSERPLAPPNAAEEDFLGSSFERRSPPRSAVRWSSGLSSVCLLNGRLSFLPAHFRRCKMAH